MKQKLLARGLIRPIMLLLVLLGMGSGQAWGLCGVAGSDFVGGNGIDVCNGQFHTGSALLASCSRANSSAMRSARRDASLCDE